MSPDRPEVGVSAAERLTFFSDAVVAIAITLLAVELPVPEGSSVDELWQSMRHDLFEYVAFILSFFVISQQWIGHHRVYKNVVGVDSTLVGLNFCWLFAIVLTPFATKFLSPGPVEVGLENTAQFIRLIFYALVQMFAGVSMLLMMRHLRIARLARPGDRIYGPHWYVNTVCLLAAFLVSVPVAFVTTWAWVLWIVVPPIAGALARQHMKDTGPPR